MNQSTEIKDLFAAFAQAQAEFVNIKADEKARVQTKSGGSFEYSYAGLGAYLALVRPILAKFKLFTMQGVEIKQSNNAWVLELETRVGHESGQWTSSTTYFPVPTDPQQAGSIISYMRRYTLAAFLGLATEDDDGATGKSGARSMARRSEPLPSYAGSHDDNAAVVAASTPTPTADADQPSAAPATNGAITWGTVMTRASSTGRGDLLPKLKELRDKKAAPDEGLKLLGESLPQAG